MVQAGHHLGGGVAGHAAGRGRDQRQLRPGRILRRLHHQPAPGRPARRQGLDRLPLRRRGAGARARWPGTAAGTASVPVEERQVGARDPAARQRRAGLLGEPRLPQLRRPMARAAVLGRLTWRFGRVLAVRDETPTARTLVLDVPDWPGHLAGQHVDVRLTAEDGYQAQRSYSIASAPGGGRLELTVQRLDDGEVSPYLTQVLRPGDPLELRGPIGGWFVWHPGEASPVLLAAGGSGVVPLMAMVRTRLTSSSPTPMRLIYSTRGPDMALYSDELRSVAGRDPELRVDLVYTRQAPAGWSGPVGRLDAAQLAALGWPPAHRPASFLCGPTGFVEAVANLLIEQGHDPQRIKTERFGPSGS